MFVPMRENKTEDQSLANNDFETDLDTLDSFSSEGPNWDGYDLAIIILAFLGVFVNGASLVLLRKKSSMFHNLLKVSYPAESAITILHWRGLIMPYLNRVNTVKFW